jgi:Phosphate-selective porin O and P
MVSAIIAGSPRGVLLLVCGGFHIDCRELFNHAGRPQARACVADFSEINLNVGSVLFAQPVGARPNIQGGKQTDFTIGLNWYPDKGIRFMANWVNVLQLAAPLTGLI